MIIPNSDLVLGRWALHMDEQILFDHLKEFFILIVRNNYLALFIKEDGQIMGPFFLMCMLQFVYCQKYFMET